MNSGMIGKIEKARRYTEERDRFRFDALQVRIHGDNSDHIVTLQGSEWRCDCDFFRHNQTCAHTMSLAMMLQGMVPDSIPAAALV